MTSRLNREIEATLARMMVRMSALSEQMRIADNIIAQLDDLPRTQDEVFDSSDDESSWSEYEHEDVDSSDYDDDATSVMTAAYQSEYYEPLFGYDSDTDYDSDEETVVVQWEDPFMTPEKPIGGIIIPADVDAGLEALV
jgi:hypothetical protein